MHAKSDKIHCHTEYCHKGSGFEWLFCTHPCYGGNGPCMIGQRWTLANLGTMPQGYSSSTTSANLTRVVTSPAVGFALWCITVNTWLEQDLREWIDWNRPIYARGGSWNHSALPVVPILTYLCCGPFPLSHFRSTYTLSTMTMDWANHGKAPNTFGNGTTSAPFGRQSFCWKRIASTERVCISIAGISGLVFVPCCIYHCCQVTLTTWLPTS
jgi:hypothetical protein